MSRRPLARGWAQAIQVSVELFEISFSLFFSLFLSLPLVLEPNALGSPDLDRQYELESIGVLKTFDNMDSLFDEYVISAYKDYFSHQTRFMLNDLTPLNETLDQSKLPYQKVVYDIDILRQLARSSHSQSIIRTKVIKEGSRYRFVLDWLHAPRMETIGSIEFDIQDLSNGKASITDLLGGELKKSLSKLLASVPFLGNITGRDGHLVTINLGSLAGLRKGDILSVGTLEEVKLHPLLKKIVEWKTNPTGRIQIEQAEEGISFCKVLEEEPGMKVSSAQKILHIQKTSFEQSNGPRVEPKELDEGGSKGESMAAYPAKLGKLDVSLFPGFYDRQYSDLSGNSNSGGGAAFGSAVSGEVLLTRDWFVGLDFKFGVLQFFQNNISTGQQTPASLNGGVSETIYSYRLSGGYLVYFNGHPGSNHSGNSASGGTKGWLKGSFQSDSYNMPTTAGEFTGPVNFSSFFIGVGADLAIRQGWGVIANVNYRLFTTVTQNWIAGTVNGTSDVEFNLGGYHRFSANLGVKVAINVVSNGATTSSGATLNQKMISIAPSILYYF